MGGDSSSAWASTLVVLLLPPSVSFSLSLTLDSRPPRAVLPVLQTIFSLCWLAAELVVCVHLLVPFDFTDIANVWSVPIHWH